MMGEIQNKLGNLMQYKIMNMILKTFSTFFTVILVLSFVLNAFAITVNPNNQFKVGNETYTFYQTMEFESITCYDSYIIFNDTGFYISSAKDILITLVYIDEDIASASGNEKVLAFYADTSSGSVDFDISGFPVGKSYLIKRDGSPIDISNVDVSGKISFVNSVWDDYLFEIYQWSGSSGENPPIVSNIPDQTIYSGESFNKIYLDSYVFDFEDPDEDIIWSYSGNTDLLVSIGNRIATISVPYSDWVGFETITFTAEDTDGMTDSDDATFKVIANYAPLFSDLSISNGADNIPISISSLSLTIEDPDGDSFYWAIQTSPNIGSISRNNHYNGTKSCSVSSLTYSTIYHWTVRATDGRLWTNKTYSFKTEADPNPPPPPPIPPPGDGWPLLPPDEVHNNSPETPIKPSGPSFVEIGVQYKFSSSTFDVDGDMIKFKFDWGDGYSSPWTEFVDSNTSVSRSYYWSEISTYAVRVIAQDTYGLNSNWSLPLNVIVAQAGLGVPPVAVINISGNNTVNRVILFNASGSFDPDGFITYYNWDFGDGEVASGINVSHMFNQSGQYNVTLIVTDNNGTTYSKSIIVDVTPEYEKSESKEQKNAPLFDFTPFIIIFVIAVLAFFVIFFRDRVTTFVSSHIINPFLNIGVSYRKYRIKKLDSKIFELYKNTRKMGSNYTISNQLPTLNVGSVYDENQKNHIRSDSDVSLLGEEKKSIDDFDKILTSKKVDILLNTELDDSNPTNKTEDETEIYDTDILVDELLKSKMQEKTHSK